RPPGHGGALQATAKRSEGAELLAQTAPLAGRRTKKGAGGNPGALFAAWSRCYCLRAMAVLPSPIDFRTVLSAFMYIENSWLSAVSLADASAATFGSSSPTLLACSTMLSASSPTFLPMASAMACSQLVSPVVDLPLRFRLPRLAIRSLT